MVKSPWKLLTGLLSRGKAAAQHGVGQARSTDGSNESEGLETNSTAVEASIKGEPKPPAVSQADKVEVRHRLEPSPSIAADVPDTILAAGNSALAMDHTLTVKESERRNQEDRTQLPTRRNVKAEMPGHTKGMERETVLAEQAAPDEPDPIRALNSEIQELRSQLAVKLRLQNGQLRQMLSRFEPK